MAERRAAGETDPGRRGEPVPFADSDTNGVERRAHADPADRGPEEGRGAHQGDRRPGEQEAQHQPPAVPRRHRRDGRRLPRHERGLRADVQGGRGRAVRARSARAQRPAGRPVRARRPAAHGALEHGRAAVFPRLRARAHGSGDLGVQVQSVPPGRRVRRARQDVAGAEPPGCGRRDQRQHLSPDALREGCVLRQPDHGGPVEQRDAWRVSSWRPERPSAQQHRGIASRRRAEREADCGGARFRQQDLRLAAHAGARPALSGKAKPVFHGAAGRGEPSRCVEGLHRRHVRAGDNDPPDSPLKQWRLDDEQIAYPSYDFILRQRDQLRRHPGFRNICIHKGFSPAPIDTPEWGKPTDIPKASHDWPELNFIIYHACFGGMTPFLWPSPGLANIQNKVLRNGEPDITWLTEFAQTCGKIRNVYAEIGSTFGGIVITFPSVCAHLLGQLLKHFGEDKIVFGSDCIYYGSPQWQIEAMWRFEIPESIRRQYGYPALTERAKRKILGLNSARLYGVSDDAEVSARADYRPVPRNYDTLVPLKLKTLLEFPGLSTDALAKARQEYLAEGADPSHLRYGWVRTKL